MFSPTLAANKTFSPTLAATMTQPGLAVANDQSLAPHKKKTDQLPPMSDIRGALSNIETNGKFMVCEMGKGKPDMS